VLRAHSPACGLPIGCDGTADHGLDGPLEASGVRGSRLVVGEEEMHGADKRGRQRGDVGGRIDAAEVLFGAQVGADQRGRC
jgi:hypothetical protein